MSDKIFVLLGKTCSGKTTIAKKLEENNFNRVVSFTTRPMRTGEVEGVDYLFYDTDIILFLIASGKVIGLRSYIPAIENGIHPWYYGFRRGDIINDSSHFMITDLNGLLEIEDEFGKDNVISIYLDVDEKTQTSRCEGREGLTEEQLRRIKSDNEDFTNVEKYVDHIIDGSKKIDTVLKNVLKVMEGA